MLPRASTTPPDSIAGGEKNRPGTSGARKAGLLAEVRVVAGDHGEKAGIAVPPFAGQPIDLALPGADPAGSQQIPGRLDLLFQFAAALSGKIRGLKHLVLDLHSLARSRQTMRGTDVEN